MSIPYSRFLVGSLTWYSTLIVLGIVAAFLLGLREEKRLGLPADTMIDATLIAVPCGIIGSRLYYVAMEWGQFASDPIRILYIWEGGVAIYGAILGGGLGVCAYALLKKRPLGKVVDMIAPGLLVAQAIGRWGNYFNMEAYGAAITDPAWMFFPFGVQIPESGYTWHMATFFYEFTWDMLAFGLLMLLRKRQKQHGNVFFWYLLLYGSGRYIIEPLRTDSLWLGGFRISQVLSLALCTIAALLLLWRTGKRTPLPLTATLAAALLAISRWFWEGALLYLFVLALLLAVLVLCLHLTRPTPGVSRVQPGFSLRRWWVFIPFLGDVTLFFLTYAHPSPLSLALHTVGISLTLPLYVLWLQERLAAKS